MINASDRITEIDTIINNYLKIYSKLSYSGKKLAKERIKKLRDEELELKKHSS